MSYVLRLLTGLASPAGSEARLSVLIFHRVLANPDPLFPQETTAETFDWQIAMLKRVFNVLPLEQAVSLLQSRALPARAAAITFDDGYRDNAEIALPILRSHGVPATFFIASGFLDGGCMWNDVVIETVRRSPLRTLELSALSMQNLPIETLSQKRQAVTTLIGKLKYLDLQTRAEQADVLAKLGGVDPPRDLMMSSTQVRELFAAGMGIGAHTVHHPILARLKIDAARAEIENGKHALENLIQAPIHLFAYPNGKPNEDYNAEHVGLAQALGFRAAFSTAWGTASRHSDLFQLPRFTPWDRTPLRFGARLAHNLVRNRH